MLTVGAAAAAEDISFEKSDTKIIKKDTNKNLLSSDNRECNLKTSEENRLTQSSDKIVSAQNNQNTLSAGEGNYSNLRDEINSGGNNIILTKNTYRYNPGDGNTITIAKSCTIDGNGTVIDMNGSNIRAFYVTASGVTIKNLIIKNANYTGNGGAIYFQNTGNVTNCHFTDNTANYGGAVFFLDTGNVTNCNFTDNTANYGSAVYFNTNGEVTNCNFINNTADYGGAVYFNNYEGTVSNCNFTDNTADYGSAVYFNTNGEVTNCNFVNNTASGGGGAIRFSGTGTVTNCNFVDNKATGDYSYGGAIYIYSGTVTNCNFVDNEATGDFGRGGAVYLSSTGNVTNCNFNANTAGDAGAIHMRSGTVTNCNFINNKATDTDSWGGAVYFQSTGTVTNCNFTDNTADYGGAVYFQSTGTVTNCNFTDNSATVNGGAIWIYSGTVTNCNFTDNTADFGGAVYFQSTGTVTNCNFTDNTADFGGGAIFSVKWYTTADTCIFKRNSGDNVNTVIYPPTLNVNNFTTVYGSGEKLTFDLKTNSSIPVPNGNILISVYFKDNGEWVRNYTCLSGEGWIPDLPVGSYIAVFDTEYAEFQKINRTVTITMPNVRYSINVSSVTTNNKTVNITAKTDIPKNILWDGKLLFILPNNITITANYAGNGTWWANYTFNEYSEYEISALYIGLDNVTVNNATITINKIKTELSADAVTTTYNVNKYLTITLKDVNGNPLKGVSIYVDLNGAKTYTTDGNGQVKVSTKGLAPKTYTAKVTFNGNDIYDKSVQNVKVTVKKAASKITAAKKTFKAKTKVKKYAAVLKDNTGKAIKNAKLTLKVKGKTYSAKTNYKGKAVFKITKLNKKGTYKAVIKFNGNKYYLKSTKNTKITVKASKTTFKTVSQGSKDTKTVKKIQQALKDHGYYLSYKGHYLKVDGKYESCTSRSVKEFQHDKGLKVTGKVDEKTAHKLGII